MDKRIKLAITVVIVLLLGGGYYAYQKFQNPQANSYVTPPMPVEVVTVQHDSMPNTMQAIGSLQALQQVDISPQIEGQIKKILFSNGQYVKKGMLLVQMKDEALRAQLKSSSAALILNKIKYQRLKILASHSAVSQQDLDQALSDYRQAQAQVAEDRVAVQDTMLRAPFDGYIGARQVDQGQFVTVGEKIASVVVVNPIKVNYSVPASDVPQLHLGQKIYVSVAAYPGKKFPGTMTFISPYADPSTRAVQLQAVVPNINKQLSPGMFADILQILGVDENTLVVPIASLVPSIQGTIVYRIVGGRAISTDVEVGTYWQNKAEIKHGLKAGDTIVLAGQDRLRDGHQVKIVPNTWKGPTK